ncbi:MAG TPA: hypothetical protein VHO70_11220 [Chitinispirillaceae bacterium]|nr:hypothetical protein [Chitinispirillaceae bacterium]
MHNIHRTLFTILFIFCFQIFSQQSVEIDRYGKRVQIDGYLVEWSEKTSKKWDSTGNWQWDVVNTPEGISGYFRSLTAQPCSSLNVTIESSGGKKPFTLDINSGIAPRNAFFRIDQELYKESKKLVIEWVIPWDQADIDRLGRYALDIRGNNRCGDTISSIMITGNKEPPAKIITGKIIIQAVFIVILLSLYIVVRIKIMRQKHRKQ